MSRSVNLLPWRESRRRDCLRYWALLCVGLWLIALAHIVSTRLSHAQYRRWLDVRTVNDNALLQALVRREKALRAELAHWEAEQRQAAQRAQTMAWQSTLQTLAEKMPSQAWLTAVRWQGRVLEISGLANRFPALTEMDSALKALPGFRVVQPGATRQDPEGRWQFSYQLRQGESDVSAH